MPRYIFKAATATFSIGSASEAVELWFGIESDDPIDLEEYSRDTGHDLIPCEGMSEEEISSCQVRKWLRL